MLAQYPGLTLRGTGNWSRDETCFFATGHRHLTWQIVDIATGTSRILNRDPIDPSEPVERANPQDLALIGNDGLLVVQTRGGRGLFTYQPADSHARYPVLNVPMKSLDGLVSLPTSSTTGSPRKPRSQSVTIVGGMRRASLPTESLILASVPE